MEKIGIDDIYRDASEVYREAVENVKKNGAVCAHPRTGTPIENPYLKIMAQYGALLAKLGPLLSTTTTVAKAEGDPYGWMKE